MKRSSLLAAVALALSSAPAYAHQPATMHATFSCPVKHVAPEKIGDHMVSDVLKAVDTAFDAALGLDGKHIDQPKITAKLAAAKVDERRMAELAEVSGCAALIDEHSSCSLYFDPEHGDPLSFFMRMKKTAPLRRQFEAALARIRDPESKRAAQACVKLVGTP